MLNHRFMMVFCLGLGLGLALPFAAQAGGLNSSGNTLPMGAGGVDFINLQNPGGTPYMEFFTGGVTTAKIAADGTALFGGDATNGVTITGSTGTLTAPLATFGSSRIQSLLYFEPATASASTAWIDASTGDAGFNILTNAGNSPNGTAANATFWIDGSSGSATFAKGYISLNTNGSATFSGRIGIGTTGSTGVSYLDSSGVKAAQNLAAVYTGNVPGCAANQALTKNSDSSYSCIAVTDIVGVGTATVAVNCPNNAALIYNGVGFICQTIVVPTSPIPPVCGGTDILQFDGRAFHCVPNPAIGNSCTTHFLVAAGQGVSYVLRTMHDGYIWTGGAGSVLPTDPPVYFSDGTGGLTTSPAYYNNIPQYCVQSQYQCQNGQIVYINCTLVNEPQGGSGNQ